MAECSYARCLQQRRHIKRELMKRYKDMLYIIGLERVGEELMGRRKWKQYQEAVTRSQLSADIRNLDQNDISNQKHEPEQKLEKAKENSHQQQQSPQEQQQQTFENDVPKIKTEVFDVNERALTSPHIKRENCESSSVVTEGSIKLNNNTTTSHKNNSSKKDNDEELLQPPPTTSPQTPPPPVPIDWTPNEKCNFCVDGKLLTVNEKGELVAESSPALSEADLANRPPGDTDSDSSDSLVPDARVNASKVLTSRFRDLVPSNMTSLQSMAAAQAQWLQTGLGQFYPNILYNLTQHVSSATPTTSETSAAAISPSLKDSPSPSDLTGEQPLDLSSKPSPNSSIGGDARHVHRAKPRVTPCTGRRTYTEEELNSALQDIISGRLGTRRAAVQYNIPRSTLRNKVYKISSGAKRETPTSLHHLASLEDLADVDDDKQNLSADEEDSSGEKILGSSLASHVGDDLSSRFGDANLAASIQKMCAEQNSLASQHLQPHSDIQAHNKPTTSLESQPKRKASTPQPPPQPQTSPLAQNAWPNVLLQTLLLSGSSLPVQQNIEEALQLFNALLLKQDPTLINPQFLMQLQQAQQSPQSAQQQQHQQQHQQQQHQQQHQQQQQQQQQLQLHANATGHPSQVATFQNRQPKSETPETASSVDLNETLGDDPSTHILRIPSYKPVAGSSTSSTSSAAAATAAALCNNNKNGESLPTNSPKIPTASTLLGANTSTQQLHHHHHLHPHHNPSASAANNIPGISPPLIRHTSGESQSPPTLSLRDMIANSISRNFSQQASKEATSPSPAHSASTAMDHNDQYKRPSISVIKNIGGTDTSRFATAPNILGSHHNSNHHHQQHHHHQHHSQNAANNNLAGGKGTRPKRGKYRNYDRDSLVEAVKAVQRGEMSVHRAGSYYGVPHSTLEYKVKERHLMRPRKREPKPQPPLDDRTGGSTSCGNTAGSSANTSKNSNIPSLSAVNSLDKLSKSSGAAGTSVNQKQSAAGKSNPPFPTTSPNGMKLPPAFFDPSLSAQLQYPSLLWHGGFGPLQMDLSSRSAAAAAVAVAAAAGGAPGNPYAANAELFKSQMLQRFHEERGPPNDISSPPGAASLSNSTPGSTNNSKSVREIAENLYDTSGANGSFLDGIIRKTLDRKSSELTQGALLDQLVKNSKPPPPRLMLNNERTTGADHHLLKLKRSGSPMQYHPGAIEIKRERASPTSDSSNSDSERNHRRDSDSEPPSQRHAGLHHALLSASADLNGAQHSLASMSTGSENNNLNASASASASSSSAAITTSILHEKLGQIKSETEDSL